MTIKEKFRKGQDENNTKLARKIGSITDNNLEFISNYEIEWEIKELKKTGKRKMKEFNLSDEIYREELGRIEQLDVKDVKEFIRILKELVKRKCLGTPINCYKFNKEIDKLAGEDLK